jgi:hypothetical protein
MAVLTAEQREALAELTQRERIEVVINVLVRRLEKDLRREVLQTALNILETSTTKEEAIEGLRKAWPN